MTILTPKTLRANARRLDRLNGEVARVVRLMRDHGATVHRTNRLHVTCWSLSNGCRVSDDVACVVPSTPISSASVIARAVADVALG
jgi:hypothetical protein